MRFKCDNCNHNVLSDESDVGIGYVPFCNKNQWVGADVEIENDEYCNCWDNCIDYEERK